METSYIYHAYGIKDFECTKTEYKGNTIIHHILSFNSFCTTYPVRPAFAS
jgi:hypothetical protein